MRDELWRIDQPAELVPKKAWQPTRDARPKLLAGYNEVKKEWQNDKTLSIRRFNHVVFDSCEVQPTHS